MTTMLPRRENSSFRDPSGFIFTQGGKVFRQINFSYKDHYDFLMQSGLYDALTSDGLLVRHTEVDARNALDPQACYKVIAPDTIPFVSYPYEWCFGQLKAAALLTLQVQKIALSHKMTLKDASAFNVQFIGHKPVFIDSLSFEKYEENTPWVAYKQFCEHFLAPLSLMSYRDATLGTFSQVFLDGFPLPLTSALLPRSTYLKFSLVSHIHLHAKMQETHKGKQAPNYKRELSKKNLLVLIESLERAVSSLEWEPVATEWADYYSDTNYSEKSFRQKKDIIQSAIARYQPKLVWDIGANEGLFSRLASEKHIYTVSFDIDPSAIEKSYRQAVSRRDLCLLPLHLDVSNPSPNLGWNLDERKSLLARGPADMVIAAALIHHLAIGKNATFELVARFFSSIGKSLIIEFVPKGDSQVMRLLASRKDIFPDYTQECFEAVFGRYFVIKDRIPLADSTRALYLMERHEK